MAIPQPVLTPLTSLCLPTDITTFNIVQSVTNPIAFVKDTLEKPRREETSPCFHSHDKIVNNRREEFFKGSTKHEVQRGQNKHIKEKPHAG